MGTSTDSDRRRRGTRRAWLSGLLSSSVGALLVLGASPAGADGDPLGNLVKQVQDQVTTVTQTAPTGAGTGSTTTTSTPSQDAPNPPATDSDSPGHETPNPSKPDHGSSYVDHTELGGNDLVDVGTTHSQVNDDDSTSADASPLAIGGQEISGAHASSGGTHHATFDPLAPICENSGGQVCLSVLYAEASATKSASTSRSSSRSGVANVCLGGSDTSNTTCSGPVHLGVGTASSGATRDRASGDTRARSRSSVLDLCAGPDCALKADALESDGQATSAPTASRHSTVLGVNAGGNQVLDLSQPQALAIAPACDPQLLCLFLNQGETYLGNQVAGHNQQALDLGALTGVAALTAGQSETLVHSDGGEQVSPPGNNGGHGGNGGNGAVSAPQGGSHHAGAVAGPLGTVASVLPNTGGFWSGLIGVALMLLGGGAMLLAWERRTSALV
jgi:hypothetical protein